MQRTQIEVIDWLQEVSGGEPVVLVAPNHPIMVPNMMDLQHAWEYVFFIGLDPVQKRLKGFAVELIRHPPPVICANPWKNSTRGLNFIEWLAQNQIISDDESTQIQELMNSRYVLIAFPGLRRYPWGDLFWVRKDRLKKGRIPEPHELYEDFLGDPTNRRSLQFPAFPRANR
jgi:hypothetical protein